jgi:hypothetical protein
VNETVQSWRDTFLEDGLVVVEDALSPAFCEAVVTGRLIDLGVDESDRTNWPTGRQNLPPTTTYKLQDVAPVAADVLDAIVGGRERVAFCDLPDNVILNFPDPGADWWPPDDWRAPNAGFHKDGDWFRHFLDSPEQALLGIVFWRDVVADQGATYVVDDSITGVARLLAQHPEGIDPPVPIRDILAASSEFRALTGRQGTIVWAHPFLLHSASVNRTNRIRVISNTTVMLREPLRLDGATPTSALEQSVLNALGSDGVDYRPSRSRERIVSERENRWREKRDGPPSTRPDT